MLTNEPIIIHISRRGPGRRGSPQTTLTLLTFRLLAKTKGDEIATWSTGFPTYQSHTCNAVFKPTAAMRVQQKIRSSATTDGPRDSLC